MTAPDGGSHDDALAPGGFAAWQAMTEDDVRAKQRELLDGYIGAQDNLMGQGGILRGFENIRAAIENLVSSDYVGDLSIIRDHSGRVENMEALIDQMILQGNATKYEGNNEFTPSPGVVSLELILIGGGGGGGAGKGATLGPGRVGGGGGGGGGEVHATIPAVLLEKNADGVYDPIRVEIGVGGEGGQSAGDHGHGGGDTVFGDYLTAGGGGGGIGGSTSILPAGGDSGAGMIPGGVGGYGAVYGEGPAFPGGHSTSPYALYGGGGGGGGGATDDPGNNVPQSGGIGGISAGGAGGGGDGAKPNKIIATGGGGGGGGTYSARGGHGGFPAGAGGGGGTHSSYVRGGNGANGLVFVIERMA
ncbi:glycine-rich domain-containing protein [Rhodococcus xishaensis]|uniref:glycine-rich domain-containing protein n=1 Tax=Rhodococcus xishaensis TaxID=2487364 RepID=UPI0013E32752|nr:hypothetical protein [Rhodococcus xishaensis]